MFKKMSVLLALVTILLVVPVSAHQNPAGCTSNGVGLSITVYRADGVTPVATSGDGSVQTGETIYYESTLSYLGGSNCYFEGGNLTITTPDGTPHVVASGAGITLVTTTFMAPQQSYVVSEADINPINLLEADATYSGGTSHTPTVHQNAAASVDISTLYTDTQLIVSKDATPAFDREFLWDIEKSVNPETLDLFDGDTGNAEYTINLISLGFQDSGFNVAGTITIHNPAEFGDAVITGVSDEISGVGAVAVDCGVVFPYNLAPAADLICIYSSVLPNGDARTNKATVTTSGDIGGGEGNADIDFTGVNPTSINEEVNINDTYDAGDAGPFNADTSYTYERTFACGDDEGQHDNTAQIVETGASDGASVVVNCYDLEVRKTAETSFNRRWDWNINKSADQTDLLLQEGQLVNVNYDVSVSAVSSDSDWSVSGEITITNNNPTKNAELVNVQDMIGATNAVVNCSSLTVPAGGSLVCTYEANLTSGEDTLNEASATQQNYDYDSEGVGTPDGTTGYNGNAPVVFGEPVDLIDECINVYDTNAGGLLGTVCADAAPHVFHYNLSFGASPDADIVLECGEGSHPNVASFIANDTGATGEDTWNVNWVVECQVGCTLTQGYWKTHSEQGPAAHPDDTWNEVGGPNATFYLSGMSWLKVFQTAPKGNAYYNLAHQYMASVLNTLAGASTTPEVDSALVEADSLFDSYTPAQVSSMKGNNAVRKRFITLAGILGSYNEGITGPGHCTE